MNAQQTAKIIEALKAYRQDYRETITEAGARLLQGQRLRSRTALFKLLDEAMEPEVETPAPGANVGHGHVFPRSDGMRARCGGPPICAKCAKDLARLKSGAR